MEYSIPSGIGFMICEVNAYHVAVAAFAGDRIVCVNVVIERQHRESPVSRRPIAVHAIIYYSL